MLLHPASTDSRAFGPNLEALSARFHSFTPERRGHGHTHDIGPITFDLMAEDTIKFLERVVGGPARLLGYSDGAIVSLLVALRRPDLVRQLAAVAGVFHRDGWIPEVIDPNNVPPDFMAKSYGEVSPDGEAHFHVVANEASRAPREGARGRAGHVPRCKHSRPFAAAPTRPSGRPLLAARRYNRGTRASRRFHSCARAGA